MFSCVKLSSVMHFSSDQAEWLHRTDLGLTNTQKDEDGETRDEKLMMEWVSLPNLCFVLSTHQLEWSHHSTQQKNLQTHQD